MSVPKNLMDKILRQKEPASFFPLALRLLKEASNEEANTTNIVSLIQQDSGMTGRILRLVNSSAFSRGRTEVSSIAKAVSLLGQKRLRMLALTVSLQDALPLKQGGPDYMLFWCTSLQRAILCRDLTVYAKLQEDQEETFVAGLMQEMGLPLLLQALSPEQLEGFPGMHVSMEDQAAWAQDKLGLTHRQVGAEVMTAWRLPKMLIDCQPILPEAAPPGTPPLALLSDLCRRAVESFFAPGVELISLYQLAQSRFNISKEIINQTLLGSLDQLGASAEAMEIRLNDKELEELAQRARKMLASLA